MYELRNAEQGSLVWHAFEMTKYTHSFIGNEETEKMFVKVANYNFEVLRFIQLWSIERERDQKANP